MNVGKPKTKSDILICIHAIDKTNGRVNIFQNLKTGYYELSVLLDSRKNNLMILILISWNSLSQSQQRPVHTSM